MATRILYVITKANWGGAQRYVYDLATAAKAEGFDVAVAYGEGGLLIEKLAAEHIRTISVPELGRDVRLGKDLAAYRALITLFKSERPDVVHLNSSKAGFVGARAARGAGVPKIIFTAHGWAFTEPRPALTRKLFKLLQHLTLRFSTHVIAVSERVAATAPSWGLSKSRVELIPLGIREPSYISKEAARAALIKIEPSLEGKEDELWVGTIAELHRNKGIDIGVAGWKKASLPRAEWIVIGGGEEKNNLLKLVGNSKTIHLLDFVPDAARYLKAFDLFLLPSRTEALGYVLLEAGLAGIPAITNGVGGTGEAVPPEYTPAMAFFAPENPDSLAEMLVRVTGDRDNLKRVGQRLSEYVRDKFSFERMIRETLALYR